MQPMWVMMWSLVRAAVRRTALPAVVVGACAGNVCIARADIQPTEPFYVTVTRADAELRCREGDISYVVATLKPGTVLRGDGRGEGWLRVSYPAGLNAVVKASEATYDAGGKKVTLATPSRLRALDIAGGARAHWWHLLEQNQPAGTTFPVIEVLTGPEGSVEAYKVPAPAGAKGFLREDVVRDATAEEIARSAQATGAPTPGQPSAQPGTGTQAAAPGTSAAPAGEAPAVTTPVVPAATITGPEDRLLQRVDALAKVFNDVQGQPLRQAEIEPVIAEFERAIASLGQSETEQALKGFLTTRLELLSLRREIRAQLAAIDQNSEAIEKEAKRIEALVAQLSNAGRYAVVGRLTPSTVYDGRRLPLMYRIESVGSGLSRTLAYLKPKPEEDFAPMLGRIVGVVGQIESEPDSNIRIVRHTVVDLVERSQPVPLPVPAEPDASAPSSGGGD